LFKSQVKLTGDLAIVALSITQHLSRATQYADATHIHLVCVAGASIEHRIQAACYWRMEILVCNLSPITIRAYNCILERFTENAIKITNSFSINRIHVTYKLVRQWRNHTRCIRTPYERPN